MGDDKSGAGTAGPSREQLMAYVKKAKIKIKKLETEVDELKKGAIQVTPVAATEEEDVISSMWGGISSLATNIVTEVASVVKDEDEDGAKTGNADAAPSSTAIARDQDATDSRELADMNKTLAAELQQVKELLREKTMESEVLGKQVVKAETEVMTLQTKLSQQEKESLERIAELESQTASSREKLAKLQASIDSTNRELIESKKATEVAQKQSLEFQKAIEATEGAMKKLESEASSERNASQERVHEQTKRAEKAEGEIMVLCEQQVTAENKAKALDAQIKELEKQAQAQANSAVKEGKEKSKKKKGGKADEKVEAAADPAVLKDLTAKLEAAEKEKQALQAAVDFNSDADKADTKKLAQTEELNKKTMAKIKELKAENRQLREDAETLRKDVTQAQAQVKEKEKESERSSAAAKLQQEEEEGEEAKRKAMQDSKAELARAHEQHLREKDGLIAKAEEALHKAREALQAKEGEHTAAVGEAAKHREDADKYRSEAERKGKEVERHAEEVRKHKAEADKHRKAAENGDKDAKKHQAETDKHRAEADKHRAEAAKHAEELRRLTLERDSKESELASQWEGQRDASVREHDKRVASLESQVKSLEKAGADQTAVATELRRKLGVSEKEASEAREERERQRRRVLELEGEAETHQMTVKESEADTDAIKAEHSKLSERMEAVGASLQQAEGRAQRAESAVQDKDKQVEAGKQREQTLSEKVTRLKTLLQRSKQLAQEKEQEVEKMAQSSLRMRRFQVLAMVEVQQTGEDGSSGVWCCALDHDESSHVRWVPHADTAAWLEEGSSLVGESPELLQTQHSRELKTVRVTLEKDRDAARGELKELSEAFAAYKSRAQTALKRVGGEERQLKQHEEQLQRATSELARLSERYEGAQREVEEAKTSEQAATKAADAAKEGLVSQQREADAATASLRDELQSKEQERETALASVKALECRLQGLEQALQEQQQQHQIERQQQQQQQPMTPVSAQRAPEPAKTSSGSGGSGEGEGEDAKEDPFAPEARKKTGAVRPAVSAADATARNELELSRMLAEGTPTPSAENKQQQQQQQQLEGGDIGVYPFLSPQGPGIASSPAGESKSVLQRVADERAHAELLDMRRQNEALTSDLQDLQHKFGLSSDQLSSLKGVIRELEATLEREREFNGSEQQAVNMEYLTNVLRKFLLSAVPSERSRLALVLCQILKFTTGEVREITGIWEERKGLSGWFQRRSLAGVGATAVMEAPPSNKI